MKTLSATSIDVWTLCVSNDEPSGLEAWLGVLSENELVRYSAFRFERHRREYLAAHGLLRLALSSYFAIEPAVWAFSTTPAGKPEVSNVEARGRVGFSLSHTEGMVVCALSGLPRIGVDVEKLDRAVEILDIARESFAPLEYAALAGLPPEEQRAAFYRLWTLKEACGKATGEGLTAVLRNLAFDLAHSPATFAAKEDPFPARWFLHESNPRPGYQMALAVSHLCLETLAVRLCDGSGLRLGVE